MCNNISLKEDLKIIRHDFLKLLRDLFLLLHHLLLLFMAIDWRKINTRYLKVIGIIAVAIIVLIISVVKCNDGESKEVNEEFATSFRVERPEKAHRISPISYRRLFNDMNDKHLSVAKKIGIKPLNSREDIENATRQLVATDDADAYVVDELTHSVPYLIPEGAQLLSRIGENFQDSLVMKHLPPCKIIVTSILRTYSDVKRLGRGNVNASKNSAHCYATTFDITYKRFYGKNGETDENAAKMKAVLGEVLRDLKKEGYCFVKHEVKQACFHITVCKGF